MRPAFGCCQSRRLRAIDAKSKIHNKHLFEQPRVALSKTASANTENRIGYKFIGKNGFPQEWAGAFLRGSRPIPYDEMSHCFLGFVWFLDSLRSG
jgi:hypothetical protein